MAGTTLRHLHTDGGDLLVAHPDARVPRFAVRDDPEARQRGDDDILELAHVGHDVAQPVSPLGQGDDRVPDELAGTVVGHVAPPVGPDELGTDRGGRYEHVGRIGRRAERVHVRVLEQQEVVVGGALVQRALQLVGFPIGHPTEPARSEHQSSSSSQLCCSSTVRMACRNAAAYAPSKARWSHVRTSNPVW